MAFCVPQIAFQVKLIGSHSLTFSELCFLLEKTKVTSNCNSAEGNQGEWRSLMGKSTHRRVSVEGTESDPCRTGTFEKFPSRFYSTRDKIGKLVSGLSVWEFSSTGRVSRLSGLNSFILQMAKPRLRSGTCRSSNRGCQSTPLELRCRLHDIISISIAN